MRWYVNDVSLQGQFTEEAAFEGVLVEIIGARARLGALRRNLRTARALPERFAMANTTVRQAIQRSRNRDLRSAVLVWLDRSGPFLDDDRQPEADDYFECSGVYVSESGLGEAARRVKAGESASTFSFVGGLVDFSQSPLVVSHGLAEDRLGTYHVLNFCTVDALIESALNEGPPITTWRELIQSARERFPRLWIPDSVFQNSALSREPFEASIRDRAFDLLSHLDTYMAGRAEDGSEGAAARKIVEDFFTGERALFSGESQTNQNKFRSELTFADPETANLTIFAHWHGKISHRFFRLHFEWPVPKDSVQLKVLYLGPKLTKT